MKVWFPQATVLFVRRGGRNQGESERVAIAVVVLATGMLGVTLIVPHRSLMIEGTLAFCQYTD